MVNCTDNVVVGLNLDHGVQELGVEPVPHVGQGPAGHQDMLYAVDRGETEPACCTERGLIACQKVIAHDVAGKKFQVHPQLFYILRVEDIMQGRMWTTI